MKNTTSKHHSVSSKPTTIEANCKKLSHHTSNPDSSKKFNQNMIGYPRNYFEQPPSTSNSLLFDSCSWSKNPFFRISKPNLDTNNGFPNFGTFGRTPDQSTTCSQANIPQTFHQEHSNNLPQIDSTKEPKENNEKVLSPGELQADWKSEIAQRRKTKQLEREHFEAIVSGVQAAKPDFSLELASEDFPALNTGRGKRVYKKAVKNSLKPENIQQVPTEISNCVQNTSKSWKPKKKDPIQISLHAALQSTLLPEKKKTPPKKQGNNAVHNIHVGNTLDSDQPQQKRGKVRPDKDRKPTTLKRQILLERNERRQTREGPQGHDPLPSTCSVSDCEDIISPFYTGFENELSLFLEHCTFLGPETTICVNNEQPCLVKSLHSDEKLKEEALHISKKIHSRKFREYCTNCLTEDLTLSICALLEKVANFQDRSFAQNPIKANAKRRYVAGISQTNKFLQVEKKVKLLVIAPDLEKNSKEGGLDEKINSFIREAESQEVPCVFGPNRSRLGRAVFKRVFVSCVAVLNCEGAEEQFSKVIANLEKAQEMYRELTSTCPKSSEEDVESTPILEEVPEKALDNATSSLLAALREEISPAVKSTSFGEEMSPAERLLRAIDPIPDE